MQELIPYVLVFAKVLIIPVSLVFLISGVDDIFVDLYHAIRSLHRKMFVMRKYRPLTQDQLLLPAEQPMAIMIPAWDEAAVVRKMLENTLQTVNYANYQIFIGTYPNDDATPHEVELVREQYENVHRVVCPKDGPTNKADCLNWIYQGIQVFEKETGVEFAIFVIEDSEDIIHPLSLKLFNYLLPRFDMVQLPVFPLESDWYRFTPGHYLDEFAENHSKDLLVRERLSKSIPCAGVACAFSRQSLELMAESNKGQVFNIESLTEDYDFGFRLHELGLKQIFVRQAIERVSTKRSLWSGKSREVVVQEYIAVREFFPQTFWASVRQKGRWVVGIALQGWASLGWRGGGWTKFMLYRDRKALVSNLSTMLGYLALVAILMVYLLFWLSEDPYRYPSVVERGTWLWTVIVMDTVVLGLRSLQRSFYVQRVYGWPQAFLSIPRQVWGNVINFAATGRALYLFARYLVTGELIAWDKTAHVYPTEEELKTYRRKLGDLLLEKRFVSVNQLDEALSRQRQSGRPLGAVLVEMGFVQEDDLLQILGTQFRLSTREIDPYETPLELLQLLPRELAVKHSIYPMELLSGGRLLLAANNPLGREQVEELERVLDRPVEICLSTRSDTAFAIRRGYERLEQAAEKVAQKSSLGQLLVSRLLITPANLREALKVQRRSFARLGDVLLEEGIISSREMDAALSQYSPERHGRFGDFLVQGNYLTLEQLEKALELQRTRFRPLGDILVELEMITRENLQQVLRTQAHAS